MKRYDITDVDDRLDPDIHDWLLECLTHDQYRVVEDGFLITCYYVSFQDPAAETAFLLRWK